MHAEFFLDHNWTNRPVFFRSCTLNQTQ